MLMRLSNGFGLGMGMAVVSIFVFCFILFLFFFSYLRWVENIGPVRLTWKRYIR